MLSTSARNRLAFILTGMVLLHIVFFLQQWRYIRVGLPDFTIFYTAGKLVGQGKGGTLYNDDSQRAIEKDFSITVARGGEILPYNHPPFEAGLFVPLARLPYVPAYLTWLGINLFLAAVCILLLRGQLQGLAHLPGWFWLLVVLAFPPVFIALMQGQDVVWVLLCYGMTYAALRRNSDYGAGAWLALGLCKFHLILPFLFSLVWGRRVKVIVAFLLVAAVLALIGFGFTGVRESLSYPGYVWKTDHTAKYRWSIEHSNNPNIRSLIINVFRGASPAVNLVVLAASVVLVLWSAVIWQSLMRWGDTGWKLGFALNVFTTVLVSYHTWVQDMSLLLLPILIVLDVLASRYPDGRFARVTLLSSAALLFFGPLYLILLFRVDRFFLITIVILAFMTGMMGLAKSVCPRTELVSDHQSVGS